MRWNGATGAWCWNATGRRGEHGPAELPAGHPPGHQKGVKVVCVSQCLFDGVDLSLYPMGILAAQAGVESGGPMTLEAAVIRLMWSLANETEEEA